ncbi:hypothetical protein Trydic_g4294 [Trypoxylus dichotomus]
MALPRGEHQYLKNKNRKVLFRYPTCSDLKLQLIKLHELITVVSALENELKVVKESIIQEIASKQPRENNIILHNIPQNIINNRSDQVAPDAELIGDLSRMGGPGSNLAPPLMPSPTLTVSDRPQGGSNGRGRNQRTPTPTPEENVPGRS